VPWLLVLVPTDGAKCWNKIAGTAAAATSGSLYVGFGLRRILQEGKHGGFGTRIPTPTLKLVCCVIVESIVYTEVQNRSIYREFREIEIPKP
jgi:hypothetical protein